jgi:hypothetical protein
VIDDTEGWQRFLATPPDFDNLYWRTVEQMMDVAIERCEGRYVVGNKAVCGLNPVAWQIGRAA